jgi:hypothetical protein
MAKRKRIKKMDGWNDLRVSCFQRPLNISTLVLTPSNHMSGIFLQGQFMFWWCLLAARLTHLVGHFFRNACTKSGSLRFSQFSGCWLIFSVYILMSFDFPFVGLFGVRKLCYYVPQTKFGRHIVWHCHIASDKHFRSLTTFRLEEEVTSLRKIS